MSTFSFTFPDVVDKWGRPVKNATIEAHRTDTHALVETQVTDSDGSATFTLLPLEKDESFHVSWGDNAFWSFIPWGQIVAGGTGASTAKDARKELGIEGLLIKMEMAIGD